MAVFSSIYESYDLKGDREDLTPAIYNIDPVECPFMSSIGVERAIGITHEWQTDVLETAAFNAVDEGNEAAYVDPTATLRPRATCQISEKTIRTSGTADAIAKAGRGTEMAYQLARLGKSLKRDIEFTLTQDQIEVTGSSGVPRKTTSYENWMAGSTADRASDGVDPTITAGIPTVAQTDGTARKFYESQLKNVIHQIWENGGSGELIMPGGFNKQTLSAFSGNSSRFDRAEDMQLITAVSVYISDFHTHRVVANRFSRPESVLVVSTELWAIGYLRPFKQRQLAVTGDADNRMMNVEYCLVARNRLGSGLIADLTTS